MVRPAVTWFKVSSQNKTNDAETNLRKLATGLKTVTKTSLAVA